MNWVLRCPGQELFLDVVNSFNRFHQQGEMDLCLRDETVVRCVELVEVNMLRLDELKNN